jgi:hypothetical protein
VLAVPVDPRAREEDVLDLLVAPDAEPPQPLDEFEKIGRANQQLFQVRETTFPSRSVSIDKAELAGTVTLTGGSNLPAEFSLVRVGGQWKLSGYHIGSG